jgi:hypothetical protein
LDAGGWNPMRRILHKKAIDNPREKLHYMCHRRLKRFRLGELYHEAFRLKRSAERGESANQPFSPRSFLEL